MEIFAKNATKVKKKVSKGNISENIGLTKKTKSIKKMTNLIGKKKGSF